MDSHPSSRKKRVLVVDDHKAMTHLVKALLEKTGEYLVEEENESLSVIGTMHRFEPDLVVLDIQMPGLDGNEMAAHMQTDRKLRHTAIVFLTSTMAAKDAAKGIDGHPCLLKPIGREELVRVMEDSLTQARTGWMKMPSLALEV